jgi:hypothetical protein
MDWASAKVEHGTPMTKLEVGSATSMQEHI